MSTNSIISFLKKKKKKKEITFIEKLKNAKKVRSGIEPLSLVLQTNTLPFMLSNQNCGRTDSNHQL